MSGKLYVIGIGPGDENFTAPAAGKLIKSCDVIMGGKRNLEPYSQLNKEKIIIGSNLDEICSYISSNIKDKRIGVLATGDPGLYSIMETFKARLPGIDMEVVPGISSLQYLCSKVKLSWDDMYITSLHGREQADLTGIVRNNRKVGIFTGGEYRPDGVCRRLLENGLKYLTVTAGENLSYENERIVRGTPGEIAELNFDNLSIMIVENSAENLGAGREWGYATPGIPDDLFIRGDVPMTKEEIRAVSLSKLRLQENSIVCDIGAGTGSVSVECALRCAKGVVFAVERNDAGIELIKTNAQKFGVNNIQIVHGEAPAALEKLMNPDRVFIGGTGGSMADTLSWVEKLNRYVRVVINTVTIESTYEAIEALEKLGFENLEIINVSVSRSRQAGGKHLMQALNPVYIISADKT